MCGRSLNPAISLLPIRQPRLAQPDAALYSKPTHGDWCKRPLAEPRGWLDPLVGSTPICRYTIHIKHQHPSHCRVVWPFFSLGTHEQSYGKSSDPSAYSVLQMCILIVCALARLSFVDIAHHWHSQLLLNLMHTYLCQQQTKPPKGQDMMRDSSRLQRESVRSEAISKQSKATKQLTLR